MAYTSFLRQREQYFRTIYTYPFYDENSIQFIRRSSSENIISHRGCINTLRWSLGGQKLISGSDDLEVKIWDVSDLSSVNLNRKISTGHTSNIFCADLSPVNSNLVISAAADGTLRRNDLTNSQSTLIYNGNLREGSNANMIHMFHFDISQPNVIYIAEDSGYATRLDCRIHNSNEVVFNRNGYYGIRAGVASSPVKMLVQRENNNLLLIGSQGFDIHLLDLRMGYSPDRHQSESVVHTYSPINKGSPSSYPAVYCRGNKTAYDNAHISVSGLCYSKDGTTILVSYHNDQIYLFNTDESLDGKNHSGAKSCLGGHLNSRTFLKTVSFFGPRDEYVVSGCDSGNMWIWDANSGSLFDSPARRDFRRDVDEELETLTADSMKRSTRLCSPSDKFSFSRPCKVVKVSPADVHTCNGVVPHPSFPILASYGIDHTAKLWGLPSLFHKYEEGPWQGNRTNGRGFVDESKWANNIYGQVSTENREWSDLAPASTLAPESTLASVLVSSTSKSTPTGSATVVEKSSDLSRVDVSSLLQLHLKACMLVAQKQERRPLGRHFDGRSTTRRGRGRGEDSDVVSMVGLDRSRLFNAFVCIDSFRGEANSPVSDTTGADDTDESTDYGFLQPECELVYDLERFRFTIAAIRSFDSPVSLGVGEVQAYHRPSTHWPALPEWPTDLATLCLRTWKQKNFAHSNPDPDLYITYAELSRQCTTDRVNLQAAASAIGAYSHNLISGCSREPPGSTENEVLPDRQVSPEEKPVLDEGSGADEVEDFLYWEALLFVSRHAAQLDWDGLSTCAGSGRRVDLTSLTSALKRENKAKEMGNIFFKKQDFTGAMKLYKKALRYLEGFILVPLFAFLREFSASRLHISTRRFAKINDCNDSSTISLVKEREYEMREMGTVETRNISSTLHFALPFSLFSPRSSETELQVCNSELNDLFRKACVDMHGQSRKSTADAQALLSQQLSCACDRFIEATVVRCLYKKALLLTLLCKSNISACLIQTGKHSEAVKEIDRAMRSVTQLRKLYDEATTLVQSGVSPESPLLDGHWGENGGVGEVPRPIAPMERLFEGLGGVGGSGKEKAEGGEWEAAEDLDVMKACAISITAQKVSGGGGDVSATAVNRAPGRLAAPAPNQQSIDSIDCSEIPTDVIMKMALRRATAYTALKDFDEALVSLRICTVLGPQDVAVSKKIAQVKQLRAVEVKTQSRKFKKMFG